MADFCIPPAEPQAPVMVKVNPSIIEDKMRAIRALSEAVLGLSKSLESVNLQIDISNNTFHGAGLTVDSASK